ncbi:MAG: adenosylcobinamide-GDP ribazoletransferase [Clostridia bacterium]|nr:adenosylcobinamide-GDP ribazoletransferase [Clostridia bacterium]MBQ2092609.1 adenosylcobinamide-GDP ribazoletransferase [Clostridia bacterium]MBQ3898018.1 adenosylcobinamide-GDP ribazoletransferase [Clostridia bacterium]
MKKYFNAMTMCFSMFCAIPSPFKKWDEEAKNHILIFLPLVGAVIGGIWTAAAYLLRLTNLPGIISAAILTAVPFLLTGGIHFDGFLDVTDAVKSYKCVEERVKILKDPNVGSFAVLYAILLVMVQFSLFAGAKADANIFALLLIPVISRSAAALCVTSVKPLGSSEYNKENPSKTPQAITLAIILAAGIAAGFIFLGRYGFVSVAVLAGYCLPLLRAVKSLKGISGDVSGYALTIAEVCGIAVFALI